MQVTSQTSHLPTCKYSTHNFPQPTRQTEEEDREGEQSGDVLIGTC